MENFGKLTSTSLATLATSALLAGCSQKSNTFSILPASQTFEQDSVTFNNKLDILFVINDQPSMSAFQQALVTSMGSFMRTFETKGFDFKIAVTTSSAYMADPTLKNYNPANEALADFNDYNGTVHSGVPILFPTDLDLYGNFAINAKPNKNTSGQDGRAFSSLRQALVNTRPVNNGFLRSDSFLAVIIVDNQDDFSGNERCTGCNVSGRYNASTLDPVDVYINFLNTVTNSGGATARYNVSAMTQIAAPCQSGTNMVRIMDLATKTNGVLGDICQADFGPSMVAISNQITVLSTQFYLNRAPRIESIVVTIDGALIPQSSTDGWSYNPDVNSIQFHGSAVPPQGAKIDVNFDPVAIL